jgi:hypothetical protein
VLHGEARLDLAIDGGLHSPEIEAITRPLNDHIGSHSEPAQQVLDFTPENNICPPSFYPTIPFYDEPALRTTTRDHTTIYGYRAANI